MPLFDVSAATAQSYATTLPPAPLNGEFAVLVDSVTDPTYVWRFRYNAGSSSSYKWEFVGGTDASATVGTSETTTSTSFTDLTTVGPQITAPRAGEYFCSGYVWVFNSASNFNSISVNATGEALFYTGANFGQPILLNVVVTVTAGTALKMQYKVGGGTGTFSNRTVFVHPKRVS